MNVASFIRLLTYLEPICCFAAFSLIRHKSQYQNYRYLCWFLLVRTLGASIGIPLLFLAGNKLVPSFAYATYFYVFWVTYAVQATLCLCIIHSIYQLAMAPLRGLQVLGTLMFRWAAGVSGVIAFAMAFSPRMTGRTFIISAVSQFQQTQGVLTVCLLLFVTFAIRPMGLSYSSKIFGVSLGLGVLGMSDLISSAWIAHSSKLYSFINLFNALPILVVLSIWITYFALPEPKRRMIILPTTSPFLRWNQISLALGDSPGFVAIGGIPPEILAPAEIEIMKRASLKMVMEPIKM